MALKQFEGKTITHVAVGTEWRQFGHPKNKRPLPSVVLAEGLSKRITSDIQEFLESPEWYSVRGNETKFDFTYIQYKQNPLKS